MNLIGILKRSSEAKLLEKKRKDYLAIFLTINEKNNKWKYQFFPYLLNGRMISYFESLEE